MRRNPIVTANFSDEPRNESFPLMFGTRLGPHHFFNSTSAVELFVRFHNARQIRRRKHAATLRPSQP
jgi:hypothetical protein